MNIVEIIKKLQSIEAKDLNLQKMDVGNFKSFLSEKPEIIVNILLIVITLGVGIKVFQSSTTRLKQVENEIQVNKELASVVKEKTRIDSEMKTFKENFPKSLPIDKVIDKISEYALIRDVQIVSFTPAQTKSDDYLSLITFTLIVSAENDDHLALFINDIENAPFAARIINWSSTLETSAEAAFSARSQIRRRGDLPAGNDEVTFTIEAKIEIGAMYLE